jgi:hypothetical protein
MLNDGVKSIPTQEVNHGTMHLLNSNLKLNHEKTILEHWVEFLDKQVDF